MLIYNYFFLGDRNIIWISIIIFRWIRLAFSFMLVLLSLFKLNRFIIFFLLIHKMSFIFLYYFFNLFIFNFLFKTVFFFLYFLYYFFSMLNLLLLLLFLLLLLVLLFIFYFLFINFIYYHRLFKLLKNWFL